MALGAFSSLFSELVASSKKNIIPVKMSLK